MYGAPYDCSYYATNPWWCGAYDDADFSSNDMCCACGGGAAPADAACAAWVKAHISLPALRPEMWSVEHDDTIAEFLTSPNQRRLLAFVDPVLGLSLQFSLPQEAPADLQYLLKPAGAAVTAENIGRVVQYGTVRGAPVGAMLRLMSGVFMPLCLSDAS